MFRSDRSETTHPFDVNNPNEIRKGGGGVLIAVRNDLDMKSTIVKSTVKAEILSIVLTNGYNKKVCLSTCYRVGTLGVENFNEIDKHLRMITKRKDISKHILIGDFNLQGITWPLGITSSGLETKFLETFSDLNLTQLITKPTHELNRTIYLL